MQSFVACSFSYNKDFPLCKSKLIKTNFKKHLVIDIIVKTNFDRSNQGSQTRWSWAVCGPPDSSVRPANNSKPVTIINFEQIWLIFMALQAIWGPHKLFYIELWPAEHFFFRIWPSNQFESKTPGLNHKKITLKDSKNFEIILWDYRIDFGPKYL